MQIDEEIEKMKRVGEFYRQSHQKKLAGEFEKVRKQAGQYIPNEPTNSRRKSPQRWRTWVATAISNVGHDEAAGFYRKSSARKQPAWLQPLSLREEMQQKLQR